MLSFVALLSLANIPLCFSAGGIVSKSGSERCPCAARSSLDLQDVPDFPQNYGIGCDFHDLNFPMQRCKGPDAPIWCAAAWCYVDIKQCTDYSFGVPGESRKLPTKPASNHIGIEWSYETCGYIDTFSLDQLEPSLANSTVSVVVLTNSGGWRGSYCRDESSCRGPSLSFVLQVLKRAQVQVEYVSKVTGSRYINGSSSWPGQEVLRQVWADKPSQSSLFTMCAYATGMGYIDLCVGSFSISQSRTKLSNFLEVYNEPAVVVAKISYPKTTLLEYIALPFNPFQPLLWLALLLSFLVLACLMVWHERLEGGAFDGFRLWEAGANSVYQVFMSVFSGGSTYESTTTASKITSLGLSFLILIVITSYTANLASHLVARANSESEFHSIEHMVNQGQHICMHENLEGPFMQVHPEAHKFVVPVQGRADVLPAMEDGRCVAGLMLREDYDSLADRCRYTLVGDPKFAVPRGIPVSARFHRVLYNTATSYKAVGGWSMALSAQGDVLRRLKGSAGGASAGGASAMTAGDSDRPISECDAGDVGDDDGMPLESLIGPFAITFVLCAFGILKQCTHRAKPLERVAEPAAEGLEKMYETFEERLHQALENHFSKQHESLHKEFEYHFAKHDEAKKTTGIVDLDDIMTAV